MLGVILVVVLLLGYTLILFAGQINKAVTETLSKTENPSQFYLQVQKISAKVQEQPTKRYLGWAALLCGIWNLFAPDFGSHYGGISILGALIPSLVFILDGLVLDPEMLELVTVDSYKAKIDEFMKRFAPIAGWISLGAAIAHSLLYRLTFF